MQLFATRTDARLSFTTAVCSIFICAQEYSVTITVTNNIPPTRKKDDVLVKVIVTVREKKNSVRGTAHNGGRRRQPPQPTTNNVNRHEATDGGASRSMSPADTGGRQLQCGRPGGPTGRTTPGRHGKDTHKAHELQGDSDREVDSRPLRLRNNASHGITQAVHYRRR